MLTIIILRFTTHFAAKLEQSVLGWRWLHSYTHVIVIIRGRRKWLSSADYCGKRSSWEIIGNPYFRRRWFNAVRRKKAHALRLSMYKNKQYTHVVVCRCTIPQYVYMNGWQASNLATDTSASALVTS